MSEINIYAKGLVYCSVCVPKEMRLRDIELAVNQENPTGVTPWEIAPKNFSNGAKNPHTCEHDSNRFHYLLSC